MDFKDGNWKTLLPPSDELIREPDDTCRGLKCQITPSGTYSWIYHLNVKGEAKPAMVTIGRCDDITATTARLIADQLRLTGRVFEVKDKSGKVWPCDYRTKAQKDSDNEAVIKAVISAPLQRTVDQLLDSYLESELITPLEDKTQGDYASLFLRCVRPTYGKMLARDFTGTEAKECLKILKGKDRARAVLMSCCKGAWEYGATLEGWNLRNPWVGHGSKAPKKRSRTLTEKERKEFYQRIKTFDQAEKYKLAWQILILAGMRHDNLCGCKWEWVDLKLGLILYPADEHKAGHRTGEMLTVVLSTPCLALVKRLHKITGHTPWLFPGRVRAGGASIPQYDFATEWDAFKKSTRFTDLWIHDLRRSLASQVSTQGDKVYLKDILGHTITDVTDIYARTHITKLRQILNRAAKVLCC